MRREGRRAPNATRPEMTAASKAWYYLSAAKYEAWEERAAIMQYDGGMPRPAAEATALQQFEIVST